MQMFIDEDWLLTDEDEAGDPQIQSLCLVHIGDQHLKPAFLSAAVRLSGKDFRQFFPGYSIEFHQHPCPGFRITAGRGWDGVVNQQTQSLARQILWEVQRLANNG
ncbi:MAG TPA: hypothetical protein VFV39_01915 [Limnobacter sp.]|nr:hypothetical protein [Limnobacter sp.]